MKISFVAAVVLLLTGSALQGQTTVSERGTASLAVLVSPAMEHPSLTLQVEYAGLEHITPWASWRNWPGTYCDLLYCDAQPSRFSTMIGVSAPIDMGGSDSLQPYATLGAGAFWSYESDRNADRVIVFTWLLGLGASWRAADWFRPRAEVGYEEDRFSAQFGFAFVM